MALKLPEMAQKLAPAKKNSRDISPVSPTFCISAETLTEWKSKSVLYLRADGLTDVGARDACAMRI